MLAWRGAEKMDYRPLADAVVLQLRENDKATAELERIRKVFTDLRAANPTGN